MKKSRTEMIVGLFMCVGLLSMAYTSVKLGKIDFFYSDYYPLKASFTSASGLKSETNVEISGVPVGKVQSIELDNYQAVVTMLIQNNIQVQEDAIASVKTNGILGEKYIEIQPGSSDIILKPGDIILDTEPPFDLLYIIKNMVIDE
jgi:phospholipid/cholesterol/gamma-HCH transport system substrate-binding protein